MENHYVLEAPQLWTAESGAATEATPADKALLKEISKLKAEVQRLKYGENYCFLCVKFLFPSAVNTHIVDMYLVEMNPRT